MRINPRVLYAAFAGTLISATAATCRLPVIFPTGEDDNDPAESPIGACCIPLNGDPCIANIAEDRCVNDFGGTFAGDGVSCAAADCPQSEGACCRFDGSCIIDSVVGCDAALGYGIYQGDGTTCEEVSCPTGACCSGIDGQCKVLTEAGCEDESGTYHGDGAACSDSLCP